MQNIIKLIFLFSVSILVEAVCSQDDFQKQNIQSIRKADWKIIREFFNFSVYDYLILYFVNKQHWLIIMLFISLIENTKKRLMPLVQGCFSVRWALSCIIPLLLIYTEFLAFSGHLQVCSCIRIFVLTVTNDQKAPLLLSGLCWNVSIP